MQKVENGIDILRRAEAKLAGSELVTVRLWERVPGKERLYLEPKSQEAIKSVAGYCSKADLRSMKNAYVDASTLEFHGLNDYDGPRAVKRDVQVALAEAAAELEAEAKASDAEAADAEDSTADASDSKHTTGKADVFEATELENEQARSEAVVARIPEGEPLTREQIASVVEAQCVEALCFEAETHSLVNSLRAAVWEEYDEKHAGKISEALEATKLAETELSSGSLEAASELYEHAQLAIEKAGLLANYTWISNFAGELSRLAAIASGKTPCEGKAEELPEQPFYEDEKAILESGEPLCLRYGMLEAMNG